MPTFTKQEKSLLNRVMDSLAGVVGVPGGWPFKWGDKFSDSTTAAVTLYVETTGNDNNPGTADKPFATIQGALDSLPRKIAHPVVVNVGAGSFAGAFVTGFQIDQPEAVTPGNYLSIVGTMATAVPATGLATGTLASATAYSTWNFPTVTVTGAGWTVNDLKGKFLKITGGTGSGQVMMISENSATVLTLAGFWSTTPNSTSTFEIQEPATIVSTGVTTPADAQAAAGSVYGFIFENNTTGAKNLLTGRLVVSNMRITTSRTAIIGGNGSARLWKCQASGTTALLAAPTGSKVEIDTCYLYSTTTNQSLVSGAVFATGSLLKGGLVSIHVNTTDTWIRFCKLEGFTRIGLSLSTSGGTLDGVHIDGGGAANTHGVYCATSSSFSGNTTLGGGGIGKAVINNCVYGVYLQGPGIAGIIQQTSGTGNTTGISLSQGAKCRVDSTATITGTTEVSVDGAATTLATMRAATPKLIKDADYGTMIYE
jgi:hypothetical protein